MGRRLSGGGALGGAVRHAGAAAGAVALALSPAATAHATPRLTPGAVVYGAAEYPEGPDIADDGILVAEMPRDQVTLIAPGAAPRVVWRGEGCGPTSIKARPGGWWLLCHLGHAVVRLDERRRTVDVTTAGADGRRILWPNDGSTDAAGNLYFSSAGLFALQAPAEGRVLRADARTGGVTTVASGLRYANGVRIDRDRDRVLVSETLARKVWSYPLLRNGTLGPRRLFLDVGAAPPPRIRYDLSGPDGILVLPDGTVVVADYGSGRLILADGEGRLQSTVQVAQPYVTNMALSPNGRLLYVTMSASNTPPDRRGVVQAFHVQQSTPSRRTRGGRPSTR